MERSGLWDELSAMLGGGVRDLSVFAPSNEAFDKLTSSLRQQLLGRHDNQHCISSTLDNSFRLVILIRFSFSYRYRHWKYSFSFSITKIALCLLELLLDHVLVHVP